MRVRMGVGMRVGWRAWTGVRLLRLRRDRRERRGQFRRKLVARGRARQGNMNAAVEDLCSTYDRCSLALALALALAQVLIMMGLVLDVVLGAASASARAANAGLGIRSGDGEREEGRGVCGGERATEKIFCDQESVAGPWTRGSGAIAQK